MSRTTINTATLRLLADDGWTMPIAVTYNGLLNMATVYPQEALLPGTAYAVTVTTGAQDHWQRAWRTPSSSHSARSRWPQRLRQG